jgi:broad specificity phosphatase PhoE
LKLVAVRQINGSKSYNKKTTASMISLTLWETGSLKYGGQEWWRLKYCGTLFTLAQNGSSCSGISSTRKGYELLMARLYLVRHGKATGSWDTHPDPGLDDLGREQAEAMAAALALKGPLPVVTSPLRRTRETAASLERRWGAPAQVDLRVGEIPSLAAIPLHRGDWLRNVLQSRWPDLEPSLKLWRKQVFKALGEFMKDTVVVSHFVAINAVVGHALEDDRVTCFHPENCSCTVLDVQGSHWKIVELGAEGASRIF